MTKRESRTISAFIDCIRNGEFTLSYATTLIENEEKYGWLSEEAKEAFYAEFEDEE